jgi:putative nucleotidyltransferase with HDIG domain
MSVEERLAAVEPVRLVRQALRGGEAWIVGGTIRDLLLGRAVRDVDVAVSGDPEAPARAVGRAIGGPVFPLSEAFGAWRAIDPARGFVYDLSRLQGETIEADLAQRDFTVNAMAAPLGGGPLLDPHGGGPDLRAGVLRVLGPEAYERDVLRPLRLARLSAELGLLPDAGTERLTTAAAERVALASPERLFGELRRLLIADGALGGIELADRLGLLAAVLPELSALHGVEQSHFHHLDVYDHTMEVLRRQIGLEAELDDVFGELAPRLRGVLEEPLADELTRGQALRFGALLHDVGKPRTRGVRPDGRVTFIGHDSEGAEMVRTLCRRLRTSERFAQFAAGLTRHHLMLGFLVHHRPLSRRDAYRYLRVSSPVEVEVTLLSGADRLATRGRNAEAAIAAHLDLARELMGEALEWRAAGPPRSPVRGDELADELGIARGPEIGRLLAALEEAAFAGEATTRDEALELARRLRHNQGR